MVLQIILVDILLIARIFPRPCGARKNTKQIVKYLRVLLWKPDGLVVSALDFRSGGQWFEPRLCRRVVSLDKKLYLTLSLFTSCYRNWS